MTMSTIEERMAVAAPSDVYPLPPLKNGVSRGGVTIAGAKDVASANPLRAALTFQNTSDTAMWVTETNVTAAVGTGYLVAPGAGVNISTAQRVSVYCVTAGKTFAATEI